MKKLYYSMGEVCEICGVDHHHIRYWETKIPALKPHKNKAGNRVFTETELHLVARLKELILDKGFSIDGANKQLKDEKSGPSKTARTSSDIKSDLTEIKLFLEELKELL